MISSLVQYRGFIWTSAVADLRHRYAGTGLGVFWNIVTPLITLSIYTFIFSNVFATRVSSDGLSRSYFPLYLSSGFLPWAAFADGLVRNSGSLVANAAYLRKLPIPEEVFVAFSAVSALIGMLIAIALLLGLAVLLGHPPSWTWLLLPLIAVLWQTLGFGIGLVLGTMNVFFRDVSQVLAVVVQLWMWSVPVVYLEELLPSAYRTLLPLNPAYPFLRAVRTTYLGGSVPDASTWMAMLGWVLGLVAVGLLVVRALRTDLRDAL